MCGRRRDCKQLFEPIKGGLPAGQRRLDRSGSIFLLLLLILILFSPQTRGSKSNSKKGGDPGQPTMFKTKSARSPIERKDGLRVLAARGRGRGLPADRFDVWMANLGPSEELRDAILAGRISWSEYSRRYLKELREPGGVDARNKRIKNHGQKFTLRLLQHLAKRQTVTLLCHCAEDEKHCHRHLLKALLEKKI
jgi:uncharacterized protein YeaO (DUF488 family)